VSESIVLRGGTVVHTTTTEVADVVIVDGRISEVGASVSVPPGAQQIDARGCWVGPGFVDLHAHLREPGNEAAETIASGARAAAVGGYSAIVAMPNTEPALDNPVLVRYVLDQGMLAVVDVAVAGAITKNRAGEHLAPIGEMAALGVRLFTDDGNGVQDAAVMRRALTYARPMGVRLAQHCEEASLTMGGVMNEGVVSSRLGLSGRPALAEELMVQRDIELVRLTGCPVHFLHLSTARAIALVLDARAKGLPVTCEVAPHHFTLDEEACETFDPTFKVHPPLRSASDVAGVRAAMRRGDVDAVATDHAPHAHETKDLAFDEAPAGMLGLEHAASLTIEALGTSDANPVLFFQLLSRGPAAIAQLRASDERPRHSAHGGNVQVGDDANIVVFDPVATRVVDRHHLAGRSINTPYHGRTIQGETRALVVAGTLVVENGELQ
jgi:dihydroorotase